MLHSAGKSGSMFGHSLRGRRMRKEFAVLAVGCLALGLMALGSAQTDKNKRPSPPAQATFSLGAGQTITVDYSSPRVKGRKIFGEHEPYGKVWRAGANEATTFVTTTDLMCQCFWRCGLHQRACRQLHDFRDSEQGQVDVDYQQENRRMGYRLPGPVGGSGAHRHEGVDAALGRREFHDCF